MAVIRLPEDVFAAEVAARSGPGPQSYYEVPRLEVGEALIIGPDDRLPNGAPVDVKRVQSCVTHQARKRGWKMGPMTPHDEHGAVRWTRLPDRVAVVRDGGMMPETLNVGEQWGLDVADRSPAARSEVEALAFSRGWRIRMVSPYRWERLPDDPNERVWARTFTPELPDPIPVELPETMAVGDDWELPEGHPGRLEANTHAMILGGERCAEARGWRAMRVSAYVWRRIA